MHVTYTGQSEFVDDHEVIRYGYDTDEAETVACWYHSGIGDEPLWAMETDLEWKISVSVDTILVVDDNNGLYRVPRDALTAQVRELDGREQYVISDEHDAVTPLGDPGDKLGGDLWITAENAHGGYHKAKNEA